MKIFFRMADPANKTFEDFERSTQGGGQSECPLGYGNEPKAQQVKYPISADVLKISIFSNKVSVRLDMDNSPSVHLALLLHQQHQILNKLILEI